MVSNAGTAVHRVESDTWFQAVAPRDAQVPGAAALGAPRFRWIAVHPDQRVELAFVAVRPGTYALICAACGGERGTVAAAVQILPKAP